MTSSTQQVLKVVQALDGADMQRAQKEIATMRRRINPVQMFIRNVIRLVVFVPLWILIALPNFRGLFGGVTAPAPSMGQLGWGIVETLVLLWLANVLARMFHVLPEWERMVLLRMGKSVGERGPGLFVIPPFLYSNYLQGLMVAAAASTVAGTTIFI